MYLNRLKFSKSMNNPIQIILASNSKLFLEGIGSILEEDNDIKVAAKVSNYDELVTHVTEIRPKFLFLDNRTLDVDINEILSLVDNKVIDTKVILLGIENEKKVNLPNVIYLNKETNSSELIHAIKGTQHKKGECSNGKNILTNTETKVVDLVGAGFSNREIAKKLSISEKTVKAHLTNIYTKLGIQNRYQLIVYAKNQETRKNSTVS
jgi:DNA-binding NarL/FixJ family response regulator